MFTPITTLKGFSSIPPTVYDSEEDRDTDYLLAIWAPFGYQRDWRDMEESDRQRSREWFREHMKFYGAGLTA